MSKVTKYIICKAGTDGFTAGKSYRIVNIQVDNYGLATYHVINDHGCAIKFGPEFFEFFKTTIS